MSLPRVLVVPAGCYLAVTVGAPLVNGGFARAASWVHGTWVVAWVLLSAVLATVVHALCERALGARGTRRTSDRPYPAASIDSEIPLRVCSPAARRLPRRTLYPTDDPPRCRSQAQP